jgi:hypothetical protein
MEKQDVFKIIDEGLFVEDKISRIYSSVLNNSKLLDGLGQEDAKLVKSGLEIIIQETSDHQRYLGIIKDNLK